MAFRGQLITSILATLCVGELRPPAADLSEAYDEQRLAAEFVLSLREVADRTALDPFPSSLSRTSGSQRARCQHRNLSWSLR